MKKYRKNPIIGDKASHVLCPGRYIIYEHKVEFNYSRKLAAKFIYQTLQSMTGTGRNRVNIRLNCLLSPPLNYRTLVENLLAQVPAVCQWHLAPDRPARLKMKKKTSQKVSKKYQTYRFIHKMFQIQFNRVMKMVEI